MKNITKLKEIITCLVSSLGLLFLFTSFVIDLTLLGRLIAQDGTIDNLFIKNYFWIGRALLFLIGLLLLFNRLYIRRIFKFKREITLLVITACFCLIVLELASFMIIRTNFTHRALKDKEYHYKNVEYNVTAQFNGFGFRDEDFEINKQYRIAIVGDSFVLGVGVEKNYTFESLVKRELQKKREIAEVYNLGYSGGDPSDYVDIIKEMYPHLKPNLTIVGFYLGNDLLCKKESLLTRVFFPNLHRLLKELFLHDIHIDELNFLIKESKIKQEYKKDLEEGLIDWYLFTQARYHPNITQEYYKLIEWFDLCNINKEVFIQLKKSVRDYNSGLIVILIPPKYQVSDQNWHLFEELGYTFNSKLLTDVELQESILSFCRLENITCIDLLPHLRSSRAFPYFMFDTHFNSIGHNITAHVILNYLKESGKIDSMN